MFPNCIVFNCQAHPEQMRNGSLFYAQIPWQHQTHPSVFPPFRRKINTFKAFLQQQRRFLYLNGGSAAPSRTTADKLDFYFYPTSSEREKNIPSAFKSTVELTGVQGWSQGRCALSICKRESEVGRNRRERERAQKSAQGPFSFLPSTEEHLIFSNKRDSVLLD